MDVSPPVSSPQPSRGRRLPSGPFRTFAGSGAGRSTFDDGWSAPPCGVKTDHTRMSSLLASNGRELKACALAALETLPVLSRRIARKAATRAGSVWTAATEEIGIIGQACSTNSVVTYGLMPG